MRLTFAQQARVELSRALTSSAQIPHPKGVDYLPFQRAGIEYSLQNNNTFFGDPPGVGKTIQSIGAMNAQGIERVLVVCPPSVVYNWQKEIMKWHVGRPSIEIYNPQTFTGKKAILIMGNSYASYLECVMQVMSKFYYSLLVIDESQTLKNTKAKRTKHVLAKNGLMSKARVVHALSGTPVVNRPIELYPIVKTLAPQAIENMTYFEYGLKYCGGFKGEWGWDFNGASNLKELGTRLRAHIMVRRSKELVLPDLPELFENVVYLDPDSTAKKLITKMKVYSDALDVSGDSVPFEELSTARRNLGESKIKPSIEYIKGIFESGHEKIVVFAHHKSVIEELRFALTEFNPVVLVGDTPTKEREEIIERFQADPQSKLFIGNITAAGIGITLTAASYCIFVEFSWVPGENEQARDRLRRIGQKFNVVADYLTYEDSLDERMLEVNVEKMKTIKEITA